MKLDPLLSRAATLAKKRDYEAAMKILREEEDRYIGSFKYYYLCGVICLNAGIFLEAKHYFESARKIKMQDPSTLLGLAILYLRGTRSKGTNTSQAVDYYLDVLELDPANKIAKKALAVIRANSSPEELSDWVASDNLPRLFPPIPGSLISSRTVLTVSFALGAAVILLAGILISAGKGSFFTGRNRGLSARVTEEFDLTDNDRRDPVETGGVYELILTRDEAVNLYENALNLFSNYRDEAAKVSLNKIFISNASQGIKNRSRLLMSNMETPGFDNFKRGDNPSYTDVITSPAFYKDVHVIWKGMATNAQVTDDFTRFDLLVGYDTRSSLEGIVGVTLNYPFAVNTERPLEVLGKIIVLSYSQIRLEGVAIHQSGKLE